MRRLPDGLSPAQRPVKNTCACCVTHVLFACFRGRGQRVDLQDTWSGSTAPGPIRMRSRGEAGIELAVAFSV